MATCKDFSDLIDKYVDGLASQEEKEMLEEHLKACPNCRREVQELKQTIALANLLGQVEMPPDFSTCLSEKIKNISEEKIPLKKTFSESLFNFYRCHKRKFTAAAGVFAVFILIVTFYNLGKNSNITYTSKENSQNTAQNMTEAKPEARSFKADESLKSLAAVAESDGAAQKMVIKNISISISTNDLSGKIEQITALAEDAGGYIESSDVKMKGTDKIPEKASINARIPEAEIDKIIETFKTEGDIVSWDIKTRDISKSYNNTAEELDSLRQYEQQLAGLLQKSEDTTEIIQIQKELYDIRQEINNLENQLACWDEDMGLSYVSIALTKNAKP